YKGHMHALLVLTLLGDCELVSSDFGPDGTVPVLAETVVSGLEVPWSIAFLPGGDLLVTERPGRIRLVHGGRLEPKPVATVEVSSHGEGGLMGLALHPQFATNHLFYIYFTADNENRLERWRYQSGTATRDRILFRGVHAAMFHDGGRL